MPEKKTFIFWANEQIANEQLLPDGVQEAQKPSQTFEMAQPGLAARHSSISAESGETGCQWHHHVDRIELICSMEGYVWKHSALFWLPSLWSQLSLSWVWDEAQLIEHRCSLASAPAPGPSEAPLWFQRPIWRVFSNLEPPRSSAERSCSESCQLHTYFPYRIWGTIPWPPTDFEVCQPHSGIKRKRP